MLCENCLPGDKYIKMVRERKGRACKLCDRPYDVYRWRADGGQRIRKTEVCTSCARVKNICQCCCLDLEYDIPYYIRDAALAQLNAAPADGTTDAGRQWLLDMNERRYALTGKSEYEGIDVERVVAQLEKKHNYDTNVPGAPRRAPQHGGFRVTVRDPEKHEKKVFIAKKPHKAD